MIPKSDQIILLSFFYAHCTYLICKQLKIGISKNIQIGNFRKANPALKFIKINEDFSPKARFVRVWNFPSYFLSSQFSYSHFHGKFFLHALKVLQNGNMTS